MFKEIEDPKVPKHTFCFFFVTSC